MPIKELTLDQESDCATKRVALVTGAGRRLGRAIALGLASAGWNIAVHYRRSKIDASRVVHEVQKLGLQSVALQADLTDAVQAKNLVRRAHDSLGGITCLVNSAAHFEFDRPEGFEPEFFERHVGPNLTAPLVITRSLFDTLSDSERGVVINILDQKLSNLNPDFFSYTITKIALEGATRIMARAFAPKLRVVGVSPGITLRSGDQSPENFDQSHRMTPLGRSSVSEDIASAVVYLAQARAITGINLIVDGGQHLMGFDRDIMYLV